MPLDAADEKKVQDLITAALGGDALKAALGSALGDALKAHGAGADKRLEAKLKAEAEARQEAVEEAVAKLKPADPAGGEGGGKGGKGQDGDAAHLKLQEKIERMERDLKAKDDEARKERDGRRSERLVAEFNAALGQTEVRAKLRPALLALFQAQGRLRYGAGGSDDAPGLHFARNG